LLSILGSHGEVTRARMMNNAKQNTTTNIDAGGSGDDISMRVR
jgi:hypothetical protein